MSSKEINPSIARIHEAAFINETTQNKCCAVVLGLMVILSAAAAGWMFSLGDAGYISGLSLSAISASFVIGTIIAVVLSVQKFDTSLQPASQPKEKPAPQPIPIEDEISSQAIVGITLTQMENAEQSGMISHAFSRLADEEKSLLLERVFGRHLLKPQLDEKEKRIRHVLIASEAFRKHVEVQESSFATQLLYQVDLNNYPELLIDTLIVKLKTDVNKPSTYPHQFHRKPKRLAKVVKDLPLYFPCEAIKPIFQSMSITCQMEFMDCLETLDHKISEPIVEALLPVLPNDSSLLEKCKTWPEIVTEQVIAHLSTCDPVRIETLFTAMKELRPAITKGVLKSLNEPQKTAALFTKWLEQDVRELWQFHLMVQSPKPLVEAISAKVPPHRVLFLVRKMQPEIYNEFKSHFCVSPLAYGDEQLVAFTQEPLGQKLFVDKMHYLASQPGWLKQNSLLAQQYFNLLVQLQTSNPSLENIGSVINSFMSQAKELFNCVKIMCGEEIATIPVQLLASRGTFQTDANELKLQSVADPEGIKAFLAYLETGHLPDHLPHTSLMVAAKFAQDYGVKHLLTHCLKLIPDLLKDHFVEILKKAIVFCLYDVRYLCLGYLSKHRDSLNVWKLFEEIPEILPFTYFFSIDYQPGTLCKREVRALISRKKCYHTDEWISHADEKFEEIQKLDNFLMVEQWSATDGYTALSLSLAAYRKGCSKIAKDFSEGMSKHRAEHADFDWCSFTDILFFYQLEQQPLNKLFFGNYKQFLFGELIKRLHGLGYRDVGQFKHQNEDTFSKTLPFLTIQKTHSSISPESCSFFAKYPKVFIEILENYPNLYTPEVVLPIFKMMDWRQSSFLNYLKSAITSKHVRAAIPIYNQILHDLFHERNLFQNCKSEEPKLIEIVLSLQGLTRILTDFISEHFETLEHSLLEILFLRKPEVLVTVIKDLSHLYPPESIPPLFKKMAISNQKEFLTHLSVISSDLSEPVVDALIHSLHMPDDMDIFYEFMSWPKIVAQFVIENFSNYNPQHLNLLFVAMRTNCINIIPLIVNSLNDHPTTVDLFTKWLLEDEWGVLQILIMVQSPQKLVETISPTLPPQKIKRIMNKMDANQRLNFLAHFPLHPMTYDKENLIAFSQHEFGQQICVEKIHFLAHQPNWLQQNLKQLVQQYFEILVPIHVTNPGLRRANEALQKFLSEAPQLFRWVKVTCGTLETRVPTELLAARGTVFKDMFEELTTDEVALIPVDDPEAVQAFFTYLHKGSLPNLTISSLMQVAALANHYDVKQLSNYILDIIPNMLDTHLPEIFKEAIKLPLYDIRYLCLGSINLLGKKMDIVSRLLSDLDTYIKKIVKCVLDMEISIDYPPKKPIVREINVNNFRPFGYKDKKRRDYARKHNDNIFKHLLLLDEFLCVEKWSSRYASDVLAMCIGANNHDRPKLLQKFLRMLSEVNPDILLTGCYFIDVLSFYRSARQNALLGRLSQCFLASLLERFLPELGYKSDCDISALNNDAVDKLLPFLAIEKEHSTISAENSDFFAKYPKIFAQFIESYPNLCTNGVFLQVFPENGLEALFTQWLQKDTLEPWQIQIFVSKIQLLARQPDWLKQNAELAKKYFKSLLQIHVADCSFLKATAALQSFVEKAPELFTWVKVKCGTLETKIPIALLVERGTSFKDMFEDLITEELSLAPVLIPIDDQAAIDAFFTYLHTGMLPDLAVQSQLIVAALANHYDMKHLFDYILNDTIPSLLHTSYLRDIFKGALDLKLDDIADLCLNYIINNPQKDNIQLLLLDSDEQVKQFAHYAIHEQGIPK
jgi:BTB/POZ domain